MASTAFWGQLPSAFVDPITGLVPTCERELSACLCLLQDRSQIPWDVVPLCGIDGSPAGATAASLFVRDGTMLAEYLLCARDYEDVKVWGAMPADLIYVSPDNRSVVIVENKIGSRFTSEGADPQFGQLGRQAEYLFRWKQRRGLASASLVLLTSNECIATTKYLRVFADTLAHESRTDRIQAFVIRWDDIFSAVSTKGAV